MTKIVTNYDKNVNDFLIWLSDNGMDFDNVKIHNFGTTGRGIQATRFFFVKKKILKIKGKKV